MEQKLDFIFKIFFMCHQLPERSFHFKGKQFPLCARCTGMLVGYILSIALVFILGLLKLWIIALLILPMAIDGTGQLFGFWKSNNTRRFITGLIGGVGIIYVFFLIGYQIFLLGQRVGNSL